MDLISIIVPCYNEQESLPLFYAEMNRVMEQMKDTAAFELMLVDDGSTDRTLEEMRTLAKKDCRVRYVSFSRNFGKEGALYAGLQKAKGDYIAVMDADLQDPPSLVPEMYRTLKTTDYDCVATRRRNRHGEPPVRSFLARCFYGIFNRMSQVRMKEATRDFRLMTRRVLDAILSMQEYNRFSKGIFSWVGFRTKWLEFENVERVAGKTKWSLKALLRYSMEAFLSFTTAPLLFPLVLGVLLGVFSVVLLIVLGVSAACGNPLAWYWILIDALSFFGGLQMVCLGVFGAYFSKMYMEIKNRPIYIVKEESEEGEACDR